MADGTHIQWAEASVNPIRARDRVTGKRGWMCTRVSPACTNCYASDKNANTYFGNGHEYTVPNLEKVEMYLEPKVLAEVIRWQRPRAIFWCSMTDLFGEFVPDAWIDKVFATIALAPQHRHIVLTKRVERAAEYLSFEDLNGLGINRRGRVQNQLDFRSLTPRTVIDSWPLPNVIIGASVENQEWADKRRPAMERIAGLGWPTWVSNEPALGAIDWSGWEFLSWMVSGGESGAQAKIRYYNLAWAREARDWCAANGIPWFMKQLGGKPTSLMEEDDDFPRTGPANTLLKLADRKGGDIEEWATDLRVREMPRC